jgi:urease accessory protein
MLALRLLALADSSFPTGGFAHSGGLEAHAAFRAVHNPDDVARFLTETTWQAALHQAPFVLAAHRDPTQLASLDRACEARLSAPVGNRASRTQGRTFFATARSVFPAELADLAPRVAALPCSHHAPVYGASLQSLAVGLDDALSLYLFSQARGVLSAAVRLGLVGPHHAQALLDQHAPTLTRAHAEALACPLDQAAMPFPLLDLRQGFHDALYARLFLS